MANAKAIASRIFVAAMALASRLTLNIAGAESLAKTQGKKIFNGAKSVTVANSARSMTDSNRSLA